MLRRIQSRRSPGDGLQVVEENRSALFDFLCRLFQFGLGAERECQFLSGILELQQGIAELFFLNPRQNYKKDLFFRHFLFQIRKNAAGDDFVAALAGMNTIREHRLIEVVKNVRNIAKGGVLREFPGIAYGTIDQLEKPPCFGLLARHEFLFRCAQYLF